MYCGQYSTTNDKDISGGEFLVKTYFTEKWKKKSKKIISIDSYMLENGSVFSADKAIHNPINLLTWTKEYKIKFQVNVYRVVMHLLLGIG